MARAFARARRARVRRAAHASARRHARTQSIPTRSHSAPAHHCSATVAKPGRLPRAGGRHVLPDARVGQEHELGACALCESRRSPPAGRCAPLRRGQRRRRRRAAPPPCILPPPARRCRCCLPQFALIRRTTLGRLTSAIREPSILDRWSPYEIALFESGICMYGKQFPTLASLVGSKNAKECIEFYYAWKKSKNYAQWKATWKGVGGWGGS